MVKKCYYMFHYVIGGYDTGNVVTFTNWKKIVYDTVRHEDMQSSTISKPLYSMLKLLQINEYNMVVSCILQP